MAGDDALAIFCLPCYCFLCCMGFANMDRSNCCRGCCDCCYCRECCTCRSRIKLLVWLLILSLIYSCLGIFAITQFYSINCQFCSIRTDIIKDIKAFEYGMGGIIFVFPIIFFGISIAFLVFTCGDRQFQVLSVKKYIIFNTLKIICIVLSSILIALSFAYAILSSIVLSGEAKGLGSIIISYFCVLYYIFCVCLFNGERKLFKEIGTAETPGPFAIYDIYGQKIVRPKSIVNANAVNPNNVIGPNGVPMQLVPIYGSNPYSQNTPNSQNVQNEPNVYINKPDLPSNNEDKMSIDNISERKEENVYNININQNVNNKN